MRILAFILPFLLSLLSGGAAEVRSTETPGGTGSLVSEDSSREGSVGYVRSRDICLTASFGNSFAGNYSSNSVSVRVNPSGRRTSPQTKSTIHIVKGGKVIDSNHEHASLTESFAELYGTHISERLLFSICRLRL